VIAYTAKHLTHSAKVLITFFLGFLGKDRCWPLATCIHKAGSSPLSTSIACNNSLKSTNSPVAAALINLVGMAGMVPLNGAKRGLDGPG